jgi:hypothetical protein
MQTSMDFHAEADSFRFRAQTIEAEQSRFLLLQLSQAWETLAEAWDRLPPAHVSALALDSKAKHAARLPQKSRPSACGRGKSSPVM